MPQEQGCHSSHIAFGASLCGGRRKNAVFLHRHFERKREIFSVRGQAKAARGADSGKHRSPNN